MDKNLERQSQKILSQLAAGTITEDQANKEQARIFSQFQDKQTKSTTSAIGGADMRSTVTDIIAGA